MTGRTVWLGVMVKMKSVEVLEGGQGWSWKTGSPEKKARMERFIDWCLTPPALRNPSSKAKLAEELGVSEQTLRNYQREPEFQRQVSERARMLVRVDRLVAVLESLYEQAANPDNPRSVAAARLLLDFAEKATEGESKTVDVKSLTDEELVEVALQMLHRVQQS